MENLIKRVCSEKTKRDIRNSLLNKSSYIYLFVNKDGRKIVYDGLRAFAKTFKIDPSNLNLTLKFPDRWYNGWRIERRLDLNDLVKNVNDDNILAEFRLILARKDIDNNILSKFSLYEAKYSAERLKIIKEKEVEVMEKKRFDVVKEVKRWYTLSDYCDEQKEIDTSYDYGPDTHDKYVKEYNKEVNKRVDKIMLDRYSYIRSEHVLVDEIVT